MMRRLFQAFRALLGTPMHELPMGDMRPLDGILPFPTPVKVFGRDRFRVSMLLAPDDERCDDCGNPIRWLVLEFCEDDEWEPLLTMHETRLPIMLSVLEDVARDLGLRQAEEDPRPRSLER